MSFAANWLPSWEAVDITEELAQGGEYEDGLLQIQVRLRKGKNKQWWLKP